MTIFLPASALLIRHLGWRHALLVLAIVQAVTVIPHAVLLRRRPADHGWRRDGVRDIARAFERPAPAACDAAAPPDPDVKRQLARALRERPAMLLTAGTVLSSAAIAAVAVHLLAYMRQDGYALDVAAAAAGAMGVVQVAGRVVLTALARHMSAAVAAAMLLAGQAAGVAALLLMRGPAGVAIFVLLFGPAFGVPSIARPDLLARLRPAPPLRTPERHPGTHGNRGRGSRANGRRGPARRYRQLHASVHGRCQLFVGGCAASYRRRSQPPP